MYISLQRRLIIFYEILKNIDRLWSKPSEILSHQMVLFIGNHLMYNKDDRHVIELALTFLFMNKSFFPLEILRPFFGNPGPPVSIKCSTIFLAGNFFRLNGSHVLKLSVMTRNRIFFVIKLSFSNKTTVKWITDNFTSLNNRFVVRSCCHRSDTILLFASQSLKLLFVIRPNNVGGHLVDFSGNRIIRKLYWLK